MVSLLYIVFRWVSHRQCGEFLLELRTLAAGFFDFLKRTGVLFGVVFFSMTPWVNRTQDQWKPWQTIGVRFNVKLAEKVERTNGNQIVAHCGCQRAKHSYKRVQTSSHCRYHDTTWAVTSRQEVRLEHCLAANTKINTQHKKAVRFRVSGLSHVGRGFHCHPIH